jgi:hypothetical protein
VIAGIIAGLVTSLILNYFGVDIELENSLDEQDNKEDENGGEPAKTREELKK